MLDRVAENLHGTINATAENTQEPIVVSELAPTESHNEASTAALVVDHSLSDNENPAGPLLDNMGNLSLGEYS